MFWYAGSKWHTVPRSTHAAAACSPGKREPEAPFRAASQELGSAAQYAGSAFRDPK